MHRHRPPAVNHTGCRRHRCLPQRPRGGARVAPPVVGAQRNVLRSSASASQRQIAIRFCIILILGMKGQMHTQLHIWLYFIIIRNDDKV